MRSPNNTKLLCLVVISTLPRLERVYRIVSVAVAEMQKSRACLHTSLPCNGTRERSGRTPALPYPPTSEGIVL